MAASRNSCADLEGELAKLGLRNFGIFLLEDGKVGLLIGNAGGEMWPHFSASSEYADGQPNPLNRWTERVLRSLSEALLCKVIFPFDRPFPPFQKFAQLATGSRPSPLGLLCHSEYGLWHAFRGVFMFESDHASFGELKKLIQDVQIMNHPCDACIEKPCLSACPVSAFSLDGLDVSTCFEHIDSGEEPKCLHFGCAARNACPIGQSYKYDHEQMKFHMRAYRS